MTTPNAEQIADWNGAQGLRWAELQRQTDGIVLPFGEAAMQTAAARPGERVIDIGCGCGDTTFELARAVGAGGRVLGVDVSQPMLDVARARQASPGSAAPGFLQADAADAALPEGNDLLFSRFGMMFFDDVVAAFRNLRAALRPAGRLVFVCWRTPRDNDWTMLPLAAARRAAAEVAPTPAPTDPHAPGPFAFADDQRLRGLLRDAGFERIELRRFDALVNLGPDVRAATENVLRIGPTSRFARELPAAALPAVTAAIETALVPAVSADGGVHLNGSSWIVTASKP